MKLVKFSYQMGSKYSCKSLEAWITKEKIETKKKVA